MLLLLFLKQPLWLDPVSNCGGEEWLRFVQHFDDKLIAIRWEVRRERLTIHVHIVDVIYALQVIILL